jgi:tartrate-resistant acid phosphatase type 5
MNCIVIGDMGNGTPGQFKVAEAMKQLYKKNRIKFVIGLGDNIYPNGCTSVYDKEFIDKFETPYSILPDDRWYMCLGNHDYGYYSADHGYKGNTTHQIEYTKHSNKWFMPSNYYSFTKGPVEFLYIDTNFDMMSDDLIQEQLKTMKHTLDTSNKKWKIVVGHHTWRSIAGHGNADKRLENFFHNLFKDTKPTMYMGGHDHCKSVMVKDGITLVISGNGGEDYGSTDINLKSMHDCRLDYFSPSLGFAILRIKPSSLHLDFYNVDGFKEYQHVIGKTG